MRSKPNKHRARGASRLGAPGVIRISTSLDVARRRGPWVHQDLWRPARPRFFSGDADEHLECRRTRRLPNNTGGEALAFSLIPPPQRGRDKKAAALQNSREPTQCPPRRQHKKPKDPHAPF